MKYRVHEYDDSLAELVGHTLLLFITLPLSFLGCENKYPVKGYEVQFRKRWWNKWKNCVSASGEFVRTESREEAELVREFLKSRNLGNSDFVIEYVDGKLNITEHRK